MALDAVASPGRSWASASLTAVRGALSGGSVSRGWGQARADAAYPVWAVRRTGDEVTLDYDDREIVVIFGVNP